jgi:hypothetical protein
MNPLRTWLRLVRILLKALLCARAIAEASSKQPPLFASGFAALRAGRQPKGDKLKNPNFLAPFSYSICTHRMIKLILYHFLRKILIIN